MKKRGNEIIINMIKNKKYFSFFVFLIFFLPVGTIGIIVLMLIMLRGKNGLSSRQRNFSTSS